MLSLCLKQHGPSFLAVAFSFIAISTVFPLVLSDDMNYFLGDDSMNMSGKVAVKQRHAVHHVKRE